METSENQSIDEVGIYPPRTNREKNWMLFRQRVSSMKYSYLYKFILLTLITCFGLYSVVLNNIRAAIEEKMQFNTSQLVNIIPSILSNVTGGEEFEVFEAVVSPPIVLENRYDDE